MMHTSLHSPSNNNNNNNNSVCGAVFYINLLYCSPFASMTLLQHKRCHVMEYLFSYNMC